MKVVASLPAKADYLLTFKLFQLDGRVSSLKRTLEARTYPFKKSGESLQSQTEDQHINIIKALQKETRMKLIPETTDESKTCFRVKMISARSCAV